MLARLGLIAADDPLDAAAGFRARGSAEAGRHAADVSSRQPAERLDPRGGDHLDGHQPFMARVQQSGSVRSAQAAEQPRTIVPDLADELVLGRRPRPSSPSSCARA